MAHPAVGSCMRIDVIHTDSPGAKCRIASLEVGGVPAAVGEGGTLVVGGVSTRPGVPLSPSGRAGNPLHPRATAMRSAAAPRLTVVLASVRLQKGRKVDNWLAGFVMAHPTSRP